MKGLPERQSGSIRERLRVMLLEVLELDPAGAVDISDELPLFGTGLSLDSRTGMTLLARISREFNVDVASEDLYLDSLRSFGTLLAYVTNNLPPLCGEGREGVTSRTPRW